MFCTIRMRHKRRNNPCEASLEISSQKHIAFFGAQIPPPSLIIVKRKYNLRVLISVILRALVRASIVKGIQALVTFCLAVHAA